MARQAAEKHGVPVALFLAQIRQESGFNHRARSPVGAIGVAQIMPETARRWGINPHDPKQALDAAARNMQGYYLTYRRQGHSEAQSRAMALAAYNAGPGAVKKAHGIPRFKETIIYVRNIMLAGLGQKPQKG